MSKRKERFNTLAVASSISGSFTALVYFAHQEALDRIKQPVLAMLERFNWPAQMESSANSLHSSISDNLDRHLFREYLDLLSAAVQGGHLRLTEDDQQFIALSEVMLGGLGGSWPEIVALFFALLLLFYTSARLAIRGFRAIRRRQLRSATGGEAGDVTKG